MTTAIAVPAPLVLAQEPGRNFYVSHGGMVVAHITGIRRMRSLASYLATITHPEAATWQWWAKLCTEWKISHPKI